MDDMTNKVMEKLREDEDFQNALKKYEEAETISQEHSSKMATDLIALLHLEDQNMTVEQARFNLLVAKMTAAKLLATLSSFSYIEKDFMDSLVNARKLVQDEIVPTLMQVEPCGECIQCKNGHKELCINPNVRNEYCESRFLPLLADALIEYDAWSEILYNSIPQDKRDIDVLKDINDDFQNQTNEIKKHRGRPSKNKTQEG